jgi:hypothetical protein
MEIDLRNGAQYTSKGGKLARSGMVNTWSANTCPSADSRYGRIFDEPEEFDNWMRGYGVVLKLGDETLGVVKMLNEQSFLATKTTCDQNGNVLLWKGGLYQLNPRLIEFLRKQWDEQLSELREQQKTLEWPTIDLIKFQKYPNGTDVEVVPELQRFLRKPELFSRIDWWHATISNSKQELNV